MGRHRDEPIKLEVVEANFQTLAEDFREWPGQMSERSKLIEMNQLSKISLIESPLSEIRGYRRMVSAAATSGKAIDQTPGQRSTTIVTNRSGDAAQPGPAVVAERNQPGTQHPAITEPTSLRCKQSVEAQPDSVEDSHLFLLRRATVEVRSCDKHKTTEPQAAAARTRGKRPLRGPI